MNVQIAPAGTGLLEGEWRPVGHLDPSGTLAVFRLDESIPVVPGSAVTFTLPMDGLDAGLVDALYGDLSRQLRPSFSLTVHGEHEPLVAPTKRRRLTGKAYRIARRRYARERGAWRRVGSPMVRTKTVLPRAEVTSMEPITPHTVSIGFRVPTHDGPWA